MVRVCFFLLSGLFCCLGFSVVIFLLFARVLFFAVWAGARAPPKQQQKNTPPPKQPKKTHDPTPSELFVFFAVWAGGRVDFFCCLGGGRAFFFYSLGGCVFMCLLFGRGTGPAQTATKKTRPRPNSQKKLTTPPLPSFLFFLLFGRVGVLIFFAVWAGGVLFFTLWAGACLCVCCLGGGREFTHLPVCLARL